MTYSIEICANSIDSVIAAKNASAKRVELCSSMPEGGTTPSYGMIKLACEIAAPMPVHVMIRPRAGDFCYSEYDLLQMESDIAIAKELGASGVVFGCLNRDGHIDRAAMSRLMVASYGLSVTFHRAFDVCKDPFEALEDLISFKVDRLLTSGQKSNVLEGAELIAQLQERAANRIIIMAGAGITDQNIKEVAAKTKVKEFHFSAKGIEPSLMRFRREGVLIGANVSIDEYDRTISLPSNIEKFISALNN